MSFKIYFSLKRVSDEVLANAVKDLGERWGQVHAGHAEQSHPKVTSSAGIQRHACPVSLRFPLLLWARQRMARLWRFMSPDKSKPSPQL